MRTTAQQGQFDLAEASAGLGGSPSKRDRRLRRKIAFVHNFCAHYSIGTFEKLAKEQEVPGFLMAVGFSGHGFQQAPAVGKALSELIRLGRYETVDVGSLSYERILRGEKVLEEEVV